MSSFDKFIQSCPDPAAAALRLDHLLKQDIVSNELNSFPDSELADFTHLISVSHFLYRFLCHHPESIHYLKRDPELKLSGLNGENDLIELRIYKYRKLMAISLQDVGHLIPYPQILNKLSLLAEVITNRVMEMTLQSSRHVAKSEIPPGIFAMGKLGASELNYSSDIDLIFLCADDEKIGTGIAVYHEFLTEVIRKFIRHMETNTEHGFLYRIDLNLRPWGRSGPLVLSVDDTEHYYEASTEAWERFAWLRARYISGDRDMGDDLLARLHPFIYHQSLSSDDLERFLMIKQYMMEKRQIKECWDVKTGEGGIRDIEFYIQLLQIVNAGKYDALKITNTLQVLSVLNHVGLIPEQEARDIENAYLFLRRLENRLQMFDERQTHELPEDPDLRLKIAKSLCNSGGDDQSILEKFEQVLFENRSIAMRCFDKILPDNSL